MKRVSLLLLALALALSACRDQANEPDVLGPSSIAVADGDALPPPLLFYTLSQGTLRLTWLWSDDDAWDLASFELVVNGKRVKAEWNLKPYEANETASFSWSGGGFGSTVPEVCVSVMAKGRSGKGTPTTTNHAQNCRLLTVPPVHDGVPLRPESITAGTAFSCGLAASGEAYCWGHNAYGQLGDGTTTDRSSARPVAGGRTFTQIGAGGWELTMSNYTGHACALTSAGDVYCWGYNPYGQLGDGTTTDRHVPTLVAGGHHFTQIAVGAGSTCGLTTTGAAYCWGFNNYGQLGDGTTTHRSTPQLVLGGITFAQISTGGSAIANLLTHTCGVSTTGIAYCWGADTSGQLGNGSTPGYPTNAITTPSPVAGGLTFRQVSAGGRHSCGVTTTGTAYCWGMGLQGQVGNGVYSSPTLNPTAVAGNLLFSRVTAGGRHTCGVATTGFVYCWGDNDDRQVGAAVGAEVAVPTAVAGALNATQISAGFEHTCAVNVTGVPYCWGDNYNGQIGIGAAGYDAATPARVQANPGLRQLSAGIHHACGLTPAGAAYCWGENGSGQLGDGTTTHRLMAVRAESGLPFVEIGAGGMHTCGLAAEGIMMCWGWNLYGQLGNGHTGDQSEPSPVMGFSFSHIAVGSYHSCGLTSAGSAYCWGNNENGQVGDGSRTNRSQPAPVTGGLAFRLLSAGNAHTCGATTGGDTYCWGRYGSSEYLVPMPVENAPVFATLTSGDRFTCGLTSGGAAHCWGSNIGQLGDGTTVNRVFPTPVEGGLTFADLVAGLEHTCGITSAGTPYCWGWNYRGQLGDGTLTDRLVPHPVAGGLELSTISGGGESSCGAAPSGLTYCWGDNTYGQLGDGTTTARLTPALVFGLLRFRT